MPEFPTKKDQIYIKATYYMAASIQITYTGLLLNCFFEEMLLICGCVTLVTGSVVVLEVQIVFLMSYN